MNAKAKIQTKMDLISKTATVSWIVFNYWIMFCSAASQSAFDLLPICLEATEKKIWERRLIKRLAI